MYNEEHKVLGIQQPRDIHNNTSDNNKNKFHKQNCNQQD